MSARPTKRKSPRKTARPRRKSAVYNVNAAHRAGVHRRMRILVKDAGGVTAFSRNVDCHPKYTYKWYSEGMLPSADYIIRFAKVGNISPDWLLLGHGTPYLDGTKSQNAA